jgi:hypothetical protein
MNKVVSRKEAIIDFHNNGRTYLEIQGALMMLFPNEDIQSINVINI